MPSARLILCEKTSRWAVAFRRALGKQDAAICETRSLVECGRQLSQSPASIVGIEVTAANLEAVLGWLVQWSRSYARLRVLILAEPGLARAEPLLREAGALHVHYSQRDVPSAVGLVRRHLAHAPPEGLPLHEAILQRLPWTSAAISTAE